MVRYVYRDIAGLTKALEILLVLGAVMAVVSLASSFVQVQILTRAEISEQHWSDHALRDTLVLDCQWLLAVVTIVTFGNWILRAHKNVRALGAEQLLGSPAWAVGYYFIPLIKLWRPYQAMKQLWQASHYPTAWRTAPTSSLLPGWWFFWLVVTLLFRPFLGGSLADRDALQVATLVKIAFNLAVIPLCLTASMVVGRIGRAQGRLRHLGTIAPDHAIAASR